MMTFVLPDVTAIRAEAQTVDTASLLSHRPGDPLPASVPAVALALLRDTNIPTEAIKDAALRQIAGRTPRLHTFVPLYTTNHCDSECKMCGMRKGNDRMVRKFAGKRAIEEQLEILYHHEHVRGVGFLTGEYNDTYTRLANAFRIGWAIRTALDMGFQRIYSNIGSMVDDEIEVLGEWLDRDDPVTMCVFQETYDRGAYHRFMGVDPSLPKGDFDRRVTSFDRWLDAGFRYVNPGALIGLHDDIEQELIQLLSHVVHLAERGAVVDVSLPRMRPASGQSTSTRVDDQRYLRLIAVIAFTCPQQRLVLTTREGREFQDQAIDLCGVFSPGSPDVAPYRRVVSLPLINKAESSQFLVADLRRPSEILAGIEATGRQVEFFQAPEPVGVAH